MVSFFKDFQRIRMFDFFLLPRSRRDSFCLIKESRRGKKMFGLDKFKFRGRPSFLETYCRSAKTTGSVAGVETCR